MKKWIGLLVGLLLCLPGVNTLAANVPEAFANGYAHDYAEVLSVQTEQKIADINAALTAANGAEVMLVTMDFVPNGADLQTYATTIFNSWAVGDAVSNNGVLILFAIGDDNYGFSMGTGLETKMSAGAGRNLLIDAAEDDFARKDYDSAALKAVTAFEDQLYALYGGAGSNNAPAFTPPQTTAQGGVSGTGFNVVGGVFSVIGNVIGGIFSVLGSLVGLVIIVVILLLVFALPVRSRRRARFGIFPRPRRFWGWGHHHHGHHNHRPGGMFGHHGGMGGHRPSSGGSSHGAGRTGNLGGGQSRGAGGSRNGGSFGGGRSAGGGGSRGGFSGGGRSGGGGSSRGAGGSRR